MKQSEMQNSGQYTVLAQYYDILNSDVDYAGWARFLHEIFLRFGGDAVSADEGRQAGDGIHLVLDLACGTGRITSELAGMGYDMIGADISADMLEVAHRNITEHFISDDMTDEELDSAVAKLPLLLCQDMRSFELYGTVDAAVCCLDGVNYLTGDGDLRKCFSAVHNYLNPNGLFVFDVNTRHKFENVFAEHDYLLEAEDVYCGWRNTYNPKTHICDFDLTFFIGNDGKYVRRCEHQRERMYTDRTLKKYLDDLGFELIGVYSDFAFSTLSENDDRAFYVARCCEK